MTPTPALALTTSLRGDFAKTFFDIVTTYNDEITSQRLLDQSQEGVYMGKTPHTPPFWPFWAYSRILPQGVELLV